MNKGGTFSVLNERDPVKERWCFSIIIKLRITLYSMLNANDLHCIAVLSSTATKQYQVNYTENVEHRHFETAYSEIQVADYTHVQVP